MVDRYKTVLGLIDGRPNETDEIIKQFRQYLYCGDFSKEFVYRPKEEAHGHSEETGFD